MQFKKFNKEELMDFLVNGIPMPDTALVNENTIDFYFEELESFINGAENDFWATTSGRLEITIAFGTTDYIVMRFVGDNVVFYMAPEVAGDIGSMTSEEASDIIGLIYGVTVYNGKWKEVSDIATQLISKDPSAISLTGGEPIKMNSVEMENLKAFVKENRKYK